MTVANNYHKISYVGNGVTTEFSFDFPILENSSIKTYISVDGVETEVDSSEYSVDISGNGGNVVFNTAPVEGSVIAIIRLTDQTQETPYKTSSGFPAVRIEEAFDKLTMITQEQQDILERCVKVNVTDNQDPQELIDEVFDKLDLATTTGEAAIAAAKEAADAAIVAKESAEYAQSAATVAVTEINQAKDASISEFNANAAVKKAQVDASVAQASANATKAENAANRAEASLLPKQTGNAGKVLLTDGSAPYWGEFKQSNHQVVSVLPVEPEEDTFYYIPE